MTPAQAKRLYFPAWNRAARAMAWQQRKGRIVAPLDQQARALGYGPEHPLATLLPRIIAIAHRIARQESRAPLANDLRHACHAVAIGRDISSTKLTNAQIDRVVALFDLIAAPDDVNTMLRWQQPEVEERQRLVLAIKRMAEDSYILDIAADLCRGAFTAPFWEDMEMQALRRLSRKIAQRRNA